MAHCRTAVTTFAAEQISFLAPANTARVLAHTLVLRLARTAAAENDSPNTTELPVVIEA